MTIKERLFQYPALQSEAQALCNRLDILQEIADIADPAELDDIERQLKANAQETKTLRNLVASLPNPTEREILTLRYISSATHKPTPWKDVEIKLYGSIRHNRVRSIQRYHRAALMHLDGICCER